MPLLDLVYYISGLDTVTVYRYVLVLGVTAAALVRSFVLYLIPLNYVPDVLKLR